MHTPTFFLQPGNLSPYYVESAAVGCIDNFLLKDNFPELSQIPSHVDYQQFHVSAPKAALTSFRKNGLLPYIELFSHLNRITNNLS